MDQGFYTRISNEVDMCKSRCVDTKYFISYNALDNGYMMC